MHPSRVFQGVALLVGLGLFMFALGIWFVLPRVLQLWIWPKTPPLGCAFVAAMLAGGAAPLVWIGLSGHLAAIRAPMLTGVVANAGIALHLFAKHAFPGNERYLPFAALFAVGSLVAAIVLAWGRQLPAPGDRSIPRLVSWAFLLLVDPRTRFIANRLPPERDLARAGQAQLCGRGGRPPAVAP